MQFDEAVLSEAFEAARQAGVLPNIHGVVVAQAGKIAFERYLAGTDAARGRPLGVVRFRPDTLHDMRSVTKSIVGLLYGIALAQGRVPGPEAKLIDAFPEYPDLAGDPGRQALTVRHALTMTLGTEWDGQWRPTAVSIAGTRPRVCGNGRTLRCHRAVAAAVDPGPGCAVARYPGRLDEGALRNRMDSKGSAFGWGFQGDSVPLTLLRSFSARHQHCMSRHPDAVLASRPL